MDTKRLAKWDQHKRFLLDEMPNFLKQFYVGLLAEGFDAGQALYIIGVQLNAVHWKEMERRDKEL